MKRKIVYKDNYETGSQQLEVKSVADDAWYNATVEVLDDTVRVRFEGFGEEDDEFWGVNYLRKHAGNISNVIRLTSPQLQDANCDSVEVDMVVCARHVSDTDNNEEDGVVEEVKYFDAKIKEVDRRTPHISPLGEECCKCIFVAEWITGPDKKKSGRLEPGKLDNSVFLTCGDICTLHPDNVESHPVVKKIRRLLDSRIRGRPSKQPVEELSNFEKSRSKRSRSTVTGGRRKCSPIPSQQTEKLYSDRMFRGSIESRESRSREEREGRAREMSQQSLGCDSARRAEKSATSNSSRSVETVESEDPSSPTLSKEAKKRSRLDGRKQKCEHPNPRKKEKKRAVHRSPKADSAKVPVKRMRGSVTDVQSLPAWYKPAGGG